MENLEEFDNVYDLEKKQEAERLTNCFTNGMCPQCEASVDSVKAVKHEGFCKDSCYQGYLSEHNSALPEPSFRRVKGEMDHNEFLSEYADKLGIPFELAKQKVDEEHKSISEIREEMKSFEDEELDQEEEKEVTV